MSNPFFLHCRDAVLDCRPGAAPHVMGILNVTPDSFSDGGQYTDVDAALRRAEVMLGEGARIIDIGGESTRPKGSVYGEGATALPADEEKRRVVPVIKAVTARFPEAIVSIDTYKGEVAKAAVEAGAAIINDVTGLRYDAEAPVPTGQVAAEAGVPIVVMHSLGRPGEMPHERSYGDVVADVQASLAKSVQRAEGAGIKDIVVDPGFGFGKSAEENLRLLAGIPVLLELGRPVLVGISRKSTIGAVLGTPGQPAPVLERLHGSLGATAVAVMAGASIVRTHDVRATADFLRVLHATRRLSPAHTEEPA
ncbi:MAG: dihydropteroate synthase [Bacteroidota bacterium]